jgi:MarR family transcriptional regulator, transcriptional regulator for hemolysin
MSRARPDHVRNSFAALLSQASRQWRRVVDHRLRPFGLTEATWRALLYIARAERPLYQKDLAELLSLEGSTLVRLVDALEAAELARREEGADRRAKEMHLTREGRRLVEEVETVARKVREEILAGIPQAELETAFRVLTRICELTQTPALRLPAR